MQVVKVLPLEHQLNFLVIKQVMALGLIILIKLKVLILQLTPISKLMVCLVVMD